MSFAAASSAAERIYPTSSGLLSHYGRLQLLLISRLFSFLLIFYVATLIFFAILRIFTGISIKRIGYMSLRHISFHPRAGVEVKIGKIGISIRRPTIARPAWISFVIANCEIVAHPDVLMSQEAQKRRASRAPAPAGTPEPAEKPSSTRSLFEEGVQTIPLLPRKKLFLLKIAQWLILNLKMVDIQFVSTTIAWTGITSLVISNANLRLDLRNLPAMQSNNFVGTLDNYKLQKNETNAAIQLSIKDLYIADHPDEQHPVRVIDYFVFDVLGVLCTDNLGLKELAFTVNLGKLLLRMNKIDEVLTAVREIRKETEASLVNELGKEPATQPEDKPAASSYSSSSKQSRGYVLSKNEKQRLARIGVSLLYLVKEIEIKIGVFELSKIRNRGQGEDTFGNPIYLATSMSDVTLNIRRMNPQSPGFKLLYNEEDTAHQAILNVASINFGIDVGEVQEEILYIPMISMLLRTNMFSQTLKYVQDDAAKFNESIITGTVNVTSPNVNIETHHLSLLMEAFKKKSLSVHVKGQKQPVEVPLTIDMPFQNILPAVDLHVSFFDAALRVVVDCDDSPGAMFIVSAGRFHTAINSSHTVSERKGKALQLYNVMARVEVDKGQVWYRSASMPRFVISTADSLTFQAKAVTQPMVSVELIGRITKASFTPTKYEIFNVFRSLYLALASPSSSIDLPAPKGSGPEAENGISEAVPTKYGFVRMLPPWLASVDFEIKDCELVAASDRFRGHGGVVLGLQMSLHTLTVDYKRDYTDKAVTRFTDGRRLHIVCDRIRSTKVSESNLDLYRQTQAQTQSHWLKIPRVTCSMITESKKDKKPIFITSVHIAKIIITANINLVMAAMVIREVFDHALVKLGMTEAAGSAPKKKVNTVAGEQQFTHVNLDHLRLKVDLPQEDHIMIELTHGRGQYSKEKNPSFNANSFKLYSKHPFNREVWCIIASIPEFRLNVNLIKPAGHEDDDLLDFDLRGLRINIPFRFQLYRIIDNSITLVKALRTLIKQTKSGDTDYVLQSKQISSLPKIPKIRIKAPSILLSLEDDPFEAQLGLIFKTCVPELEARLQKDVLFEHRIKEIMKVESDRLVNETMDELYQNELNSNHLDMPGKRSRSGKSSKDPSVDGDGDNCKIRHAFTEENLRQHLPGLKRGAHRSVTLKDTDSASRGSRRESSEFNLRSKRSDAALRERHRTNLKERIDELLDTPIDFNCTFHERGDLKWNEFFHSEEFKKFRALEVKYKPREFPFLNPGAGDPGATRKISIGELHARLVEHHSNSWIRSYNNSVEVQRRGVEQTLSEIFPDNIDPTTAEEETVVGYSEYPLLFNANFRDAVVRLSLTKFDTMEKVHEFLHKIGKGLPLDTEFSIFIPLYMDIAAHNGFKISMRDFPLPVLHFPGLDPSQDPKNAQAFRVKGNFVITEQLVKGGGNIRKLFVPLTKVPPDEQHTRGVRVIEVHRTLAPVKMYTDLGFLSQSKLPTRVTWCSSYNPTFGFASTGFSNFSKPPIDLSPVLGFWDKIRLTFHAQFTFNLENSPLFLLLKGSRDPYRVTGHGAGFAFVWRDNVQVRINPHNDAKDLFVVDSRVFQVVIPNYATWEEEYCSFTAAERAFPFRTNYAAMDKPEKLVMKFRNSTRWKLGMMFQRDAVEGDPSKRTDDFRKHYDVRLLMPEFVKDRDDYDAYRGFRSEYIFLALSVTSNDTKNESYNSVHITPAVIAHFRRWTKMFSSVFWPPQRLGKLFPGVVQKKSKFSTALSGEQYQLSLSPLLLSYFYRKPSVNHTHDNASGLKARIEKFVFDFHMRKEPAPGKKRWSTKFHVGEIDMVTTDVRVMAAKFKDKSVSTQLNDLQDSQPASSDILTTASESTRTGRPGDTPAPSMITGRSTHASTSVPLSKEDSAWIDADDFTDLGMISLNEMVPSVEIERFVYSPRFTYYHQTDNSGESHVVQDGVRHEKFGQEIIHNCAIVNNYPENTQIKMLSSRLNDLNEEVKDTLASVESLMSEKTRHPNSDQIEARIHGLNKRIEISRSSQAVLKDEIGRLKEELHSYAPAASESRERQGSGFNSNLFACGHGSVSHGDSNASTRANAASALFRNQFMIHAIHVKWNNRVRDMIFRLKTLVQMVKEEEYNASQNAVKYLETLVSKIEARKDSGKDRDSLDDESVADILNQMTNDQRQEFSSPNGHKKAAERMENFDEDLVHVDDKRESIMRSFLVRFMTPQFQVISKKNPTKCMQITAKDVELKIMTVYDKTNSLDSDSNRIERRFGVKFEGAGVFVLTEAGAKDSALSSVCSPDFGEIQDVIWPPWLAPEFSYTPGILKRYLIVDNTSFRIRFDHLNQFHVAEISDDSSSVVSGTETPRNGHYNGSGGASNGSNTVVSRRNRHRAPRYSELRIDSPQIIASCDSSQYYTAYLIGLDLLSYTDPIEEESKKAIERVILGTDFSTDLHRSLWQIKSYQSELILLNIIKNKLLAHGAALSREDRHSLLKVELEYRRGIMDFMFMMRAFKMALRKVNRSHTSNTLKTTIAVDSVYLDLLNDDGTAFLELMLQNTVYNRVRRGDQWAHNHLEVGMLEAHNLTEGAVYPEIISHHSQHTVDPSRGVIILEWTNLDPVGGITIIEDFDLRLQPVRVQVERDLYDRVFKFGFPDTGDKDDKDDATSDLESEKDSGTLAPRISFASDNESILDELDLLENKVMAKAKAKADEKVEKSKSGGKWNIGKILKRMNERSANDVSEMMDRAANYLNIVRFTIHDTLLAISYKGSGSVNLLDLQELDIPVPALVYTNKLWTKLDLMMHLKQDMIKVALHNTGSILQNKLTPHIRSKPRARIQPKSDKRKSTTSIEGNSGPALAPTWTRGLMHLKSPDYHEPDKSSAIPVKAVNPQDTAADPNEHYGNGKASSTESPETPVSPVSAENDDFDSSAIANESIGTRENSSTPIRVSKPSSVMTHRSSTTIASKLKSRLSFTQKDTSSIGDSPSRKKSFLQKFKKRAH